jgi:hypothetical protein
MQQVTISDEVKEAIRAKYPVPENETANATYLGVPIYIANVDELISLHENVKTAPPLPTHASGKPTTEQHAILSRTSQVVTGMQALIMAQLTSEARIPKADKGGKQAIVNMIWALHTELGELSNELNIKPWKTYGHNESMIVKMDSVFKELADITAFYAAIMIAICDRIGYPYQEFMERLAVTYIQVAMENIERHGVSDAGRTTTETE